ncbi:unnamed protein product [marine sediment metagenome]|uniref:Uncharacterized protein n=1 Tax=marine sediment metagenome TaxID=412755 RepID=X1V9Q0_9ZZZZ
MIKIGLGKALGFSLLAFIGLNFLFVIIAQTFSVLGLEPLFTAISNDPLSIITILFAPISVMPGNVIMSLYAQISFGTIDASMLIQTIGLIVSPFVAALVAGRTGGSKGGSFGGWMITALIGSAAWIVYILVSLAPNPIVYVVYMLNGVVYGIFYGCFALLFTKTEMY